MKKIIAISYIFAFILLCGCQTEMRVEGLNVEKETDGYLPGAIIYPAKFNSYFFASIVDSNNESTIVYYNDTKQISGCYHLYQIVTDNTSITYAFNNLATLVTPSNNTYSVVEYDDENNISKKFLAFIHDGVGSLELKFRYYANSTLNGSYYNYGAELNDSEIINFTKPSADKIKSIIISGISDGNVIRKSDLPIHIKAKFNNSKLSVTLNNDEVFEIPSFSELWSIKGIDSSSDVGTYNIYAEYFDLTSDFVKLYVLEY